MSKRATDAAWQLYPDYPSMDGGYVTQREQRELVMEGYELAEKDLALTIEDMERIHTFLYAIKNNKSGLFTFTRLSDEQYEEALRRFNEWRDKE